MKKPVEQVAQAAVGNLQAEMPRRHAFERVRLVEDDEVVVKKIAALGQFALRSGEKIEEERVIEHEHLRRVGLLARALVKAFGAHAAGALRADVGLAANLEPDRRVGRRVEIGERAVARAVAPFPDALHLVLLARGEEFAAVAHGALQPQRAEIILAALQQHRLELLWQQILHERDVLVEKLLLQVDRMGRDERLAVLRQRVKNRRHEVGETLAHAGARLDDEMRPVPAGLGHGGGHRLLLGAVLELARLGQQAAGAESEGHLPLELGGKIIARRNHESVSFKLVSLRRLFPENKGPER